MTTLQEVEFYMDDLDNEIEFYSDEDYEDDGVFSLQTIGEIFMLIQSSDWFTQGNKTEGILSVIDHKSIKLDWKTIDMEITKDGDIFDNTEDYEMMLDVSFENGNVKVSPR